MKPRNEHVDVGTRNNVIDAKVEKANQKLRKLIGRVIYEIDPSVQEIVDMRTLPAFASPEEYDKVLIAFQMDYSKKMYLSPWYETTGYQEPITWRFVEYYRNSLEGRNHFELPSSLPLLYNKHASR